MSAQHRIGTAELGGEPHAVIEAGGRLYGLAEAAGAALGPERVAALAGDEPVTVLNVLEGWDAWSDALGEVADATAADALPQALEIATPASWLAPILHPRKVIGVGANYKDHLDHAGIPHPTTPYLFLKPASTTLLGDGREMVIPHQARFADWEAELAVVIGRRARHVAESDALGVVAGYAPANDASARDWLADAIPPLGSDWLLHKGWDGFTPMGPLITPARLVPDPQNLRITLTVDGVTRQDGTTSNMIFGVATLVAHASSILTLEPGDVILTGTPMGAGFARTPQEPLNPGATMVATVESLGTLTTPTVAERMAG